MRISSGLMIAQSNTMDSLITLLSNSDKTKEAVTSLKAEQKKLSKLRQEVLEGITIGKYKSKVEEEINAAKNRLERDSIIYKAENSAMLDELKRATARAKKATAALAKKEKEQEIKQDRLEAYENTLNGREEALVDKEVTLQTDIEYATSLRDTYTDKLTDLKERMRGL